MQNSPTIVKVISSTWFILAMLMVVMLYFRIVPIYSIVFTDWPWLHGNYVNFAPDDAVYHMRLVHNTLQHFPQRIFFDPFTHFPYGNQIHFGPLFTLIIASVAWIIGMGHPQATLINAVGAYLPPFMGALCLIPTYFIGKKMFGRSAGLFAAAILAFLPGEFFYRSTLGFTDHHVAEVLFSTMVLACLIYAFTARSRRVLVGYAIGAGVALGLYLLTWPHGLLIAEILWIFFMGQLICNYGISKRHHDLMIVATALYVTAATFLMPYALFNPRIQFLYYSLAQPLILLLLLGVLWLSYSVAHGLNALTHKKVWYLLTLLLLSMIVSLGVYFFVPHLFDVITAYGMLLLAPPPGFQTVAENWPAIVNRETLGLTYTTLWYNFFWMLPLAIIAATHLIIDDDRIKQVHVFLLLVWSAAMIFATFAEQRFAYYFAINVAVLAGYASAKFFGYLQRTGLYIAQSHRYSSLRFLWFIVGIFGLLLAIVYPRTKLTVSHTWYSTYLSHDMYQVYTWLNQHTPDPQGEEVRAGFDYHRGFYPLPLEPYRYPVSAYGVLAWWPLGHQITYIAERIPQANPFQEGIVEAGHPDLGVAPFFVSTDEHQAMHILQALRARYILIDHHTANDQYWAMLTWLGRDTSHWQKYRPLHWTINGQPKQINLADESDDYYHSLLYRLYFLDGNALAHLRLIYEMPGDYRVSFKALNVKTGVINREVYSSGNNWNTMLALARNSEVPRWWDNKQETLLYSPRPPVKEVKIFENVRGATLIGQAPIGTIVELQLFLQANGGRTFMYAQNMRATASGYRFTVPYATEAMAGKHYASAVKALSPYVITMGAHQRAVAVSEKAVQSGITIKIPNN